MPPVLNDQSNLCPIALAPLGPHSLSIKNEHHVSYSTALVHFLAYFSSTSPHTRRQVSPDSILVHGFESESESVPSMILESMKLCDVDKLKKIYDATQFPVDLPLSFRIEDFLSEYDKSVYHISCIFQADTFRRIHISTLALATLRGDIDVMHWLIHNMHANVNFKWPQEQQELQDEGLPWLCGTQNYTDIHSNVVVEMMTREGFNADSVKCVSALFIALQGLHLSWNTRKMNAMIFLVDNGAIAEVEDVRQALCIDNAEQVYEIISIISRILVWPSYEKMQNMGSPLDIVMEFTHNKILNYTFFGLDYHVKMTEHILDLPSVAGADMRVMSAHSEFFFDANSDVFYSTKWLSVIDKLVNRGAKITSQFMQRVLGDLPDNYGIYSTIEMYISGAIGKTPYESQVVLKLIELAPEEIILCDPTLMTRALIYKQPVEVVQALLDRSAPMFEGILVGRKPLLFWATPDIRLLLDARKPVMVAV